MTRPTGLPPDTGRLEPDPVIEAYEARIDRGLLRENLKLTPTQRLEKLMALQRFAEEVGRAGQDGHRCRCHVEERDRTGTSTASD